MDQFMQAAIDEARKGLNEGGIPVGAVLVHHGNILSKGRNQRIQRNDPLGHAEIECIRAAGRMGSYKDSILYTTLMPCYLCGGAIVQFGIDHIIVGESRTFRGSQEFMKDHWVTIEDWDVQECIDLMNDFIRRSPNVWNENIGNL